MQPFSARPLREDARVPGFCTAKGLREQNTTRKDEQGTAPERHVTVPGRSSAATSFVASERAGESPLQGLTWRLPSDPSRQARTPEGFGGANRQSRLAQWG